MVSRRSFIGALSMTAALAVSGIPFSRQTSVCTSYPYRTVWLEFPEGTSPGGKFDLQQALHRDHPWVLIAGEMDIYRDNRCRFCLENPPENYREVIGRYGTVIE